MTNEVERQEPTQQPVQTLPRSVVVTTFALEGDNAHLKRLMTCLENLILAYVHVPVDDIRYAALKLEFRIQIERMRRGIVEAAGQGMLSAFDLHMSTIYPRIRRVSREE